MLVDSGVRSSLPAGSVKDPISEIFLYGNVESMVYQNRTQLSQLSRYKTLFSETAGIFDEVTRDAWRRMLIRLYIYRSLGVLYTDTHCAIAGEMYVEERSYEISHRWDIPGGMVMLGANYIGWYTVTTGLFNSDYYYQFLYRKSFLKYRVLPLRTFDDDAPYNSLNLLDSSYPRADFCHIDRNTSIIPLAYCYKSLKIPDLMVILYFFLRICSYLLGQGYVLVGVIAPLIFLSRKKTGQCYSMVYYGDALSVVEINDIIEKTYPFGEDWFLCKAKTLDISLSVLRNFIWKLAEINSLSLTENSFFKLWDAAGPSSVTNLLYILRVRIIEEGILTAEEADTELNWI